VPSPQLQCPCYINTNRSIKSCKQTIPHCQNNSKTNNTALSEQFKNKQYRTVGTIQKQTIPHCRNNSKTNNTALSEQFKNKQLFRQCGIVCFLIVPTVLYCLFLNCSDSAVLFVFELFRQCGIVCLSILLTQKYMTTHFRGLI
jgi:hypothetical protein